MAYRATSTTTGRPAMDRKNYTYQGDQPLNRKAPRVALADASGSRKRDRLTRFEVVLTELTAGNPEDASAAHIRLAGELVGVGERTVRDYLKVILKPGENPP